MHKTTYSPTVCHNIMSSQWPKPRVASGIAFSSYLQNLDKNHDLFMPDVYAEVEADRYMLYNASKQGLQKLIISNPQENSFVNLLFVFCENVKTLV